MPARNEEANLERCLRSLVEQRGIPFELLAVDDGSTDRTPEIIEKFAGVRECPFVGVNADLASVTAIQARPVEQGWTGKANAVWQAAQTTRGEWLLFTDADTAHEPGSLARAAAEAEQYGAMMLSYSPRQELRSLGERLVMPLVFAELASRFRPKEVRDPRSPVAAANGQYLLIKRDVYFALGGHKAVAGELLEDVALAKRLKQSGAKIRFRFGGEQVRTRMYRSWGQLVEGWTKNLVLLFPDARTLAWERMSEFVVVVFACLVALVGLAGDSALLAWSGAIVFLASLGGFMLRVRRSHSGLGNEVAAIVGLPVFAWLLLRSAHAHDRGAVTWKGRVYSAAESKGSVGASQLTDETTRGKRESPPTAALPSQENNGLSDPKV